VSPRAWVLPEKDLRQRASEEGDSGSGKKEGTFNLCQRTKWFEEEGTLPQALLPLIPAGATPINDLISVVREDKQWTYFCGVQPVFQHPDDDRQSFRMFTAQLCCQSACTQAQIIRTFGVSKNSVLRSVAKYRQQGNSGFYQPRHHRGPAVMTAEVTAQAQKLLDLGHVRSQVAAALGLKYDTLRKTINQGRLREPGPPPAEDTSQQPAAPAPPVIPSDKSARSDADAAAGEEMGIACTRPCERVLAAIGMLPGGATTQFQPCRDVSYGGVLCALPALAENGLFGHLETLPVLSGYYRRLHVILLLAYMALCRIKAVEQLQYQPSGELGKLLGLDRIPEVRCLRKKLTQLSQHEAPQRWAAVLSQQWMEQCPELTGTLYVDGHVRLYHGHLTQLPRRYVSRLRLCLRGTTDYWVNDALGRPFFSVERPIDHGLLEAIRSDVLPRLLQDVPGQPTAEQLAADPYLCRFVIVFDREGYSPAFFREMWQQHRIACITYHKYPKEPWPESEFTEIAVTMPNGEVLSRQLAERGSWIGSRSEGLWVREVRKLNDSGHQTSLVSTAYGLLSLETAGRLFARWSQENFLRYMLQHFELDALGEYRTEAIPGTNRPVVNPARRELDRQSRSLKSKLTQRQARFAALTLHPQAEESEIEKWERQKADLQEEIEQLENELNTCKERRGVTPQHLAWEELPEEQKFHRLAPGRKRLIDTVKLLAYRAETALAMIVREELSHVEEARSLIRDLFQSDADIYPDEAAEVLEVRLHTLANPRSNRAIRHLLDHLNAAEFTYPGTKLRLTYTLSAPCRNDDKVPP
jgi:transposase